MTAVQQSGHALQWANATLRADRGMVTSAAQQSGQALQWADGATLQADRGVVVSSVQQSEQALQWADATLQADMQLQALGPDV